MCEEWRWVPYGRNLHTHTRATHRTPKPLRAVGDCLCRRVCETIKGCVLTLVGAPVGGRAARPPVAGPGVSLWPARTSIAEQIMQRVAEEHIRLQRAASF